MFTRRLLAGLLFLLLSAAAAPAAWAAPQPAPPDVHAVGYELIDVTTGQVLYAHNENTPLPPASTTKIMTALLTLMQGNLGRTVDVSPKAAGVPGSSAYLKAGEPLTIRDLLYGLLLVSGNDAAVELAIADAGSVPKFVQAMNAEARRLGATNTSFQNPDGLYLPNHLISAHDLALVTRAALAFPEFRKIDATKSFLFPGQPKPYTIYNQDRLLWMYPGAIGVKIGYTLLAKETIVGAAQRNGVLLAAVVLRTDYRHLWSDPENLLNWGFANFQPDKLIAAGASFGRAPTSRGGAQAIATTDFSWLRGPGQPTPQVRVVLHWPQAWAQGEPVGVARVYAAGQQVGMVPLVASAPSAASARAGSGWQRLGEVLVGAYGLLWFLGSRRRRRRVLRRYRFSRKVLR